MTLVNLTPHPIVVTDINGNKHTFEPSGEVARVDMETKQLAPIDDFAVETLEPKGLIGVPEPADNVLYIVSAMVLEAGKKLGRADLIAPNTNKAERNKKGWIVSVPGFVR